jgi:hypothetical protein
MSGQLHAPAALSPGQNRGTHLVGGCVSPTVDGGFWVQENLFSFPEIKTGYRPIRSLLTIPTTRILSQLFTHLKYSGHVGLNLLLVGIDLDGHIHQQMHTIGLQSVRKF